MIALLVACTWPDPVRVEFTYAGDHNAPGDVVFLDISVTNSLDHDVWLLAPTLIESDLREPSATFVMDGRSSCERADAYISGGTSQWFVWRVPAGATITDRCDYRLGGATSVHYVVADTLSVAGRPVEEWTGKGGVPASQEPALQLTNVRRGTATFTLPVRSRGPEVPNPHRLDTD